MARSYDPKEIKNIYDQVNSGFTTVDRLTDKSKGDLYQYLIDTGERDLTKFNPQVRLKYGLSETPKPTTSDLGIAAPLTSAINKLDSILSTPVKEPLPPAPFGAFRQAEEIATQNMMPDVQARLAQVNPTAVLPTYDYGKGVNQPFVPQQTTQNINQAIRKQQVQQEMSPIDKLVASLASTMGGIGIGALQFGKELSNAMTYFDPTNVVQAALDKDRNIMDVIQDKQKRNEGNIFGTLIKQQQDAVAPYQEQVAAIEGPTKYLYGAAGQLAQLPFYAAGPGAALGFMGGSAGGQQAAAVEQGQIARGIDPTTPSATLQRLGSAALSGGIEAATEVGPLNTLFDIIGGKATGGTIAKELVQEFLGEGVSQLASPYVDKLTFTDTELPTIKEQLKQAADAGITGAMSAMLMVGIGMGVNSAKYALQSPTPQNVQKALADIEQKVKTEIPKEVIMEVPQKLQEVTPSQLASVNAIEQRRAERLKQLEEGTYEPQPLDTEILPSVTPAQIAKVNETEKIRAERLKQLESDMTEGNQAIADTRDAEPIQTIKDAKKVPVKADSAVTEQLVSEAKDKKVENALKDIISKEQIEKLKTTKIVDENSIPKVVYHGTPKMFKGEFSESYAPGWGTGIYFSDSKDAILDEFAEGKEENVIPVYLDIKNPFNGSYPGDDVITETKTYKEALSKANKGINTDLLTSDYFDENPDAKYVDPYDLWSEDGETANKIIKELGYDGIVADSSNSIDGKEIVVFDSSQIIRADEKSQVDKKPASIPESESAQQAKQTEPTETSKEQTDTTAKPTKETPSKELQISESGKEKELYRYELTQRPPSPGTIPSGAKNVVSYDKKTNGSWGYVEYDKPLTDKQVKDYELSESKELATKPVVPKEKIPFIPSDADFASHEEYFKQFRKGEMSFQEVIDYADYVINNEQDIKKAASKKTMKELAKYVSVFNRNDFKKADYVDSAYKEMLSSFIYTLGETKIVSTSGFDKVDTLNQLRDQVQKLADNLTESKYEKIVDNIKSAIANRNQEAMDRKEQIVNPKTLEDFEIARKNRVLTAEEVRKLEDLRLEKKQAAETKEAKQEIAPEILGQLTQSTNTKSGETIFEFELTERLTKDQWSQVLNEVKKQGGSYWKGKFYFTTDSIDKANELKQNVINNLSTIEVAKETKIEVPQKLRTIADGMQKSIDDKLAPRQTNTNRRAAMAASAQMDGDRLKRTQGILREIADRLEQGELKFLSKIDAKLQVETLDRLMGIAKREFIDNDTKSISDSYASELKRRELKDQDATIDMIDFAKMPRIDRNHALKILEEGSAKKGLMQKSKSAIASINKTQGNLPVSKYEDILIDIISTGVYDYGSVKNTIQEYNRMKRMGIETDGDLRAALREYLEFYNSKSVSKNEQIARNIKQRESEFTRQKIDGFFPTPRAIVDKMLEEADIVDGDRVLEPSAGVGHIADAIEVGELDVVEWNNSMSELLKDKGHNVIGNDALKVEGQYDKIVMNPPFEKGQDIDHVRYAYENNLKDGGRLVAIMSEGPFIRNDKKATEFREWLQSTEHTTEQFPDAFKEADRKTGVATRMVVINKPSTRTIETIKVDNPTVNTNEIVEGMQSANKLVRKGEKSNANNPLEARYSLTALKTSIENGTLTMDNLIINNSTVAGYTPYMREFIAESIVNRNKGASELVIKVPDDGTITLVNQAENLSDLLHSLKIKVRQVELPKSIASFVKNESVIAIDYEGYVAITPDGKATLMLTPQEFDQFNEYIEQVKAIDPETKLEIRDRLKSNNNLNTVLNSEFLPVSNIVEVVDGKSTYLAVSNAEGTMLFDKKLAGKINFKNDAYMSTSSGALLLKDDTNLLVGTLFSVVPRSENSNYKIDKNKIVLKPKAVTKPTSIKWNLPSADLDINDISGSGKGPKAAATYVQKLYPMQGVGKGETARLSDATKLINKYLDIPVKEGKFRQRALGIYKGSGIIRVKNAKQMDVLLHEVGHFFDQHFDLTSKISANPEQKAELFKAGKPVSRKSYTNRQVVQEGIAEFFSTYLQDKNLAEIHFPSTFKTFSDIIQNDKVSRDLTSDLNEMMKQYMEMNASERVMSNVQMKTRRHIYDKPSDIMNEVYTAMVDVLHPVALYTKNVLGDVLPSRNPLTKMRMAQTSAIGKTTTAMERGLIDPKTDKFLTKGFYEIIDPIRQTKQYNEFISYAVALRAHELQGRNIETGIPVDDMNAVIAEFKNNTTFNQVLKELYKYNDTLLKLAAENDLITKEVYESISKSNWAYIPFNRAVEKTYGNNKRSGSAIMRIKGSTLDIVNPLESIIKNTYAIYDAIDKNDAYKTLFNSHELEGAGKYFDKIPAPMQAIEINGESLADVLKKKFDVDLAKEIDRITIFQPNAYPNKDNVVSILRNGVREYYEVHDKDLMRVFSQADYPRLKIIGKILGFPARVLRAGATEFSDSFVLRNFLRDTIAASVFSESGFIPLVHSVRGVFEEAGKTDLYYQALSNGALNNNVGAIDRDYLKKDTRKLYQKDFAEGVLGKIERPLDLLRGINEAVETSTRMGEYRLSFNKNLEKGMSEKDARLQAALDSRDLMDFMRAGYVGREMNKLISFFNASIQGTDKLVRSFKKHPVQMLVKGGAYLTSFSTILWLMNHDDERYKRLDRYTKDMYWVMFLGDEIIKIPKPHELGLLFGTGVERMMDYATEKDPNAFKGYKERVLEVLLPELLPQVHKTPFELQSGYSIFYQGDIVPLSEQNKPKYLQYGTTTSEFAKAYGKMFDKSPRMVDYAIRSTFGTAGTFMLDRIDDIAYAVGNNQRVDDPEKSLIASMPFVRGLIAQPYTSSQYVEDFYEYTNEIKTKASEYRALDQEYPSDFQSTYTYINKMYKNMTNMNRIIKSIKESDISGEQKASQLIDAIHLQDQIAIKTMNGLQLTGEEVKKLGEFNHLYPED